MAQRLLLIALCAVIAVQLISSVEGSRNHGCIARCNTGCRKKHSNNVMQCLKTCWQTYPRSCQKCKKNDDRCYGCLPGFMLSNSKCIPCATGCICDQTSTCLNCRPGYVMTPNGCAVCNPGCNCDSTGKCTCKSGYVASATYDPTKPATTGPQCLACPANCADCSSTGPTTCVSCMGGFKLDDNGVCKACPSGCLVCETGVGTCDTCKTGYTKTGTAPGPFACAACPANCATCDILNSTYCDACIDGFGLTSNRKGCIPCAPNCKKCNWNGYNSCDSTGCRPGYRYNAGTCTTQCSVKNCVNCQTDATKCDQCLAGTTLTSATPPLCVGTGCTVETDGCLECDATLTTTSKCVKCASGYALETTNHVCLPCDAAFGICKVCTASAGAAAATCTQCPAGYVISTKASPAATDPICWPCDTGCKDCGANFDSATGACKASSCSDGTSPVGTAPAALCATGCDLNCASPYCTKKGAGFCDLICKIGYYLDTDFTCKQCDNAADAHCNHCLTAGKAMCDGPSYCNDGYSITVDNKCTK